LADLKVFCCREKVITSRRQQIGTNRHFDDARYYLNRAGYHLRKALGKEVASVERRVREVTGRETDPEPTRVQKVRCELDALEDKAEHQAKPAVSGVRRRLCS